jgi:hypothetical protein
VSAAPTRVTLGEPRPAWSGTEHQGELTETIEDEEAGAGGTASAYSTGGGGVVLEHAYGGALLAELLLGGPVAGLGDDVTPSRIGFQQSAYSQVDDLMVAGDGPGGQRTLFIGVRRHPKVGVSQEPFVKLMVDYVKVISEHGAELEAGSWRLGLAVEVPHTPADEIAKLAYFARRQPDSALFRAAVNAPRATTSKVRARLGNIDDIVGAATKKAGIALADEAARDDLSWRLLKYLRVLDLRLEGDDAAGRTSLVARMVPLAGNPAAADDLRRRLNELAAGYAIGSSVVTEEILRRDLSGRARVAASPALRASWQVLESLEESLRARTRRSLVARQPGGQGDYRELAVDRRDVRAALVEAMSAAGRDAGQLVVHGEPGAGKSAVVLGAVDEIRSAGGTVVTLSLRDLASAATGAAAGQLLHAPPSAVFAATVVAPVRLVVLDGAEVVQETGPGLLRDLARAASEAGLGLVAVTRDDARETVVDTLTGTATRRPGTDSEPAAPGGIGVPSLTDEELRDVRQAFGELNRLAADDRSSWLLRRLGIIDVLLRGNAVASLPDGSLSEAGVFGAVWHAWVRNHDQPSPSGATPDGREDVMTGLARLRLAGSGPGPLMTADSRALPSLRSDGLLLPAGPHFAFRAGDEFSNDTVRDFALARLFARHGFDALREAGAPRWALRAARVACQARLVSLLAHDSAVAAQIRNLQLEFDALAAASGDRWADLPWEAALTAGTAEAIIQACTRDLLQPGGALLGRVLRLVTQRFGEQAVIDPAIGAPVVAFLIQHAAEVREASYEVARQADRLVAAWLRAVGRVEVVEGGPAKITRWQPLRAQVRDYLLHSDPIDLDTKLECLALLGADMDDSVRGFLRSLAAGRPGGLAPCVERFDATMSLAATDLDLLFELTEAYYIENPATTAYRGGFNMGIRGHRYGPGIGVPFADWRFGPFWRLIPAAPARALALINRMLDHAANWRVGASAGPRTAAAVPGVHLSIPAVGDRYFVGDEHVWAWYRGTAVGPYPCVSALLAVEQAVDQWLRQGTPLSTLVAALLRDAHNLAMPGLVVGILTRHAEQVTDEGDPFLASLAVWHLESSRAVMESGIHVQGREDPAAGSSRRSWTMADLAAMLTVTVASSRDQNRMDALHAAGRNLVAGAATSVQLTTGPGYGQAAPAPDVAPPPGSAVGPHELAVARRWASMLDAGNYIARPVGDGNIAWEWRPPADLDAPLAESRRDLDRSAEAYRLINAYCLRPIPPYMTVPPSLPASAAIAADAQAACKLTGGAPAVSPEAAQAAAAVAAAVLRVAVQRPGAMSREDTEWAATTVIEALLYPVSVPGSFEGTVAPFSPDRSAASAAACLLMPAFTDPGDDSALLGEDNLAELPQLLAAVTRSPFTEVRMILARSLGPVWAAPCGPGPQGSTRCRHVIAWTAVEAGARDVALGRLELPPGRRSRRRLDDLLASALAACPAGDLLLDSLAPPLIIACGAARSSCCMAATAHGLRDSLLDAYVRAAVHWGDEGYDQHHDDQYAVAEAMLEAGAVEPRLLTTFAAGLARQPRALSETLRAMTVAATYSSCARAALKAAWPAVMTVILDAADVAAQVFDDRSWGDQALTELVPRPTPATSDSDPMAAISAARNGWPTPQELATQIERWLPRAAGHWNAADSLIGLLRTTPPADQARTGLPWVHTIIAGTRRSPGMGTFLSVEWLGSLRDASVLDAATWPLYGTLVDALAAENYPGAVELQRRDE